MIIKNPGDLAEVMGMDLKSIQRAWRHFHKHMNELHLPEEREALKGKLTPLEQEFMMYLGFFSITHKIDETLSKMRGKSG